MSVNRGILGIIALFAGLSIAASASALTIIDYPAGELADGIGRSRHNLGATGLVIHTATFEADMATRIPNTTEICVFCHTPHHGNTSISPTPLWNRVNAVQTYGAYGVTIAGSDAGPISSVSLACLSCHDGVTTFDTLVNAPGKGGINKSGADQGWVFTMPNMSMNIAGPLDHIGATQCTLCHGLMTTGPVNVTRLNIGTELKDDHPVSVAYIPVRASLRPMGTVINDINLMEGLAPSAAAAFGGNLSQNRWAVKGVISSSATIADLLKNGRVECTSCHDPHFKNASWDEVESLSYAYWCGTTELCTDGQFLRRIGGNTGSGVCRTCHYK